MNQQLQLHEEPTAPALEPVSMMEIINRAASDPKTDVDKLERLLSIYERLTAKQAEQRFNEAMTAAQTDIRPVAADADNPQTKSKYASYPTLDRAIRPIYTKHGFALSFDTGEGAPESYVKVLCHVSHQSGHSRTYHIDMPADGKGAKGGDVMTKTHAVGSAMTYGSRYLLKLIFNIAVGEDDDDGNRAGDGDAKINADQLQHVRDLIERTKANVEIFCRYFKIEAVPDLKVKDYERAMISLNLKLKEVRK